MKLADHKCGAHDHKCGAYDHKHTSHDEKEEADQEEGHANHPHVIEINIRAEVAPAAASAASAADYKKVIIGSPAAALTMKTSNCCFFDSKNNSCDAKQRSASMKKLSKVVILCLIFMTIEIIGGIKANSLAILTDAAHLLSDVAGFTISLFSLWAAGWEATPRQSFGFFRIEILGTLLSIQLIWLLTGILVYEAIDRMIHRSGAQVGGMLMTIVAACGFTVNVLMAFLLGHDHHGHGHGHGHGGHSRTTSNHADQHSHNHNHHELADDHHNHKHHSTDQADNETVTTTIVNGSIVNGSIINGVHDQNDHCEETRVININVKKLKMNINVEGAYLHALGDSLQSIGVMIGGAVIWWKPEWKIIDLICTLVFSIIVLCTTIGILKKIIGVLMESTPTEIDAKILEEGLLEMEEVEEVHELHIWAITVGKVLLACHVKILRDADAQVVLDKVIGYIQRVHNITHVTIQIERSTVDKYSVIKTTGDVEDED